MSDYQDTVSGAIIHFKDDTLTLADIAAKFPELPTTLSATVVSSPGKFYSWVNGAWVLDAVKQNAALKAPATAALSRSDTTLLRCAESAVAIPPDWAAYRKALRNIVSGADKTSVALPTQPAYPAGT